MLLMLIHFELFIALSYAFYAYLLIIPGFVLILLPSNFYSVCQLLLLVLYLSICTALIVIIFLFYFGCVSSMSALSILLWLCLIYITLP